MRNLNFALITFFAVASLSGVTSAQEVPFERGDHVVYIGNTTADRMQHHGWLESYIHALLPEYDLTFRNLGFSGDEVAKRQRANNFGDADQWLTKCEADVVFCFFGYNEALKGPNGLDQFKKDLAKMLDGMQSQKYNGSSAPRVTVFSPIAHENLNSPHLPDGSANNKNLELYTKAMEEVCSDKQVPFVNLFSLTQELYKKSDKPLTMNGIHLLDHGNRALARAIINMATPDVTLPDDAQIAELRKAVLDKNYEWFSRYRVVDEYNVFGGRSKLSWFGQSNADVMMREMEIFDVKAANRDKRIWALAKGESYTVKDDNLPQEVAVKPNRKGPLKDGAWPYIGGEEAIEKMTVHDGFEVNLFASEEQFPRLINPVQMAVDTDSRLWASVWPSYPHWNPTEPRRDALVILPDENRDGKADELIVFADELNSVTGFEFWGGGVLVAAPPEIWFLKDTDGDDRADVKIRVLQGVSSADTHHSANAMVISPDGFLNWSRGIFNVAAFETPTKTYRSGRSGVHRFNPRTFEVEFLYPIGPNPHGDVIDRWGFQFANDGTSGTGGYVGLGKGLRPGNKQWFKKEWRPVAATGILSSSQFPDANQNNFLVCNTIGFLGVLQYEVEYNGAEIKAVRTQDLIRSTDDNFRPSDIEVGGDGGIYIADWHNVLIGHMQHNMRDPNRDHEHGRIYRVTAKGRDLLTPAKMKGKPIATVLQNFFAKENGTRYRTRLELSGRPTPKVVAAVDSFVTTLDPSRAGRDRNEAQALLECLWVHEEHRVPNMELLVKTFRAKEARVRAAAIRTLGHWAGRVTGWESTLEAAAKDESALVRAEAAKTAVEYQGLGAAEVIFEVSNRDLDPELNDVLTYAKKTINVDRLIADAIRDGKKLSPAARKYAVQRADASLLMKMEKSPEVYAAILSRADISADHRWEAIAALAKSHDRSKPQQLLASLRAAEKQGHDSLEDLSSMLSDLKTAQLKSVQTDLASLTAETESDILRSAAYAAWFDAGDVAGAWQKAVQSRSSLSAALNSVAQVRNATSKEMLYDRVRPLMFELPPGLESKDDVAPTMSGPSVAYEYYEPNPSNVANKTLNGIKPKLTGSSDQFVKYIPGGRKDAFATRQTASIVIPTSGQYTFYTTSDDGSRLYIDKKLVVNNDKSVHGMQERTGAIRLEAGHHEIVVTYFDNGGGDGLIVSWKGPGLKKQPISSTALRAAGSGNLRSRALSIVAAWPGKLKQNTSDFMQLIDSKSLGDSAVSALAGLPPAKVAKEVPAKEATRLLERIMTIADAATPVERQANKFSNLLALGNSVIDRYASDTARMRLNELRASIPVKADPKVMELGKEVYARESHCITCHQPHGQGMPNLYPPLDGSIWVTGSQERIIRMVLDGMHGTIEVNGKRYSSPPQPPMTGFRHLLNDKEIAAVVTYVRNTWSNRAKPVDEQTVVKMRAMDRSKDAAFWNANDLLAIYPLEDGSQPVEQDSGAWTPKFVKDWKPSDFDSPLEMRGRDFGNGKLAFERVGCAQCHKLGEKGGMFGPNLAELDLKKKNVDYVLQSILDPSKDIEAKYAMQTYFMESGKVVSGMTVKETATEIHVVSDPLNQEKARILKKSEIEEETKTKSSIMPQGLLNWLEKDDIADLIAYVLANGKPNGAAFK